MVFVCACVFCERTIIFFAKGGAFNMSRPRGPWFLNPSMPTWTNTNEGPYNFRF